MKCIVLLVAVLAMSCRTAPSSSTAVAEDDLAILQMVLARSCVETDGKFRVLAAEAAQPNDPPYGEGAYGEALADMKRRSTAGSLLPASLDCLGIRIKPRREIDRAFALKPATVPEAASPGWDGFHYTYPGASGLLGVSLPGYSRDGRSAVVYSHALGCALCGAGFYIEFRREATGWKIVTRHPAWVA